MSLVLKFEEGGNTSKKKRLIKRGNDNIDLDIYIRNLEHNYNNWANSKKLSKKERQAVDAAYREMINEYNNGNLTPLLGGGSRHSLGTITNSKDGFDAYGVAQSYFSDILNRQNIVSDEEEKSKSSKIKYDPSKGISELFNPYLFAGRTTFNPDFILQDAFNAETGKRDIVNRNSAFLNALSKYRQNIDSIYDFDDDNQKNQFLSSLDALQNALSDGKLTENERIALSNLGLNADDYFFTGEKYGTSETSSEDDNLTDNERRLKEAEKAAKDAQVGQAADLYERYNRYMTAPDRNFSILFSNYNPIDLKAANFNEESKATIDAWEKQIAGNLENYLSRTDIYKKAQDPNWLNLVDNTFLSQVGIKKNLKFSKDGKEVKLIDDNWTNGQKLAYLFDIYTKHHEALNNGSTPTFGDNQHIMNYSGEYARVYDPSTRKMYDKRVADIPELMAIEFASLNPQQVQSNKEGGVLKAQKGLNTSNLKTTDQVRAEFAERRKLQEQAKLEQEAASTGRTIEQHKAGLEKLSDNFTTVDALRAGSMAADLISVIAAFAPGVGTAVSGVAGLTGAGLDLAADIGDSSVSKMQVAKNLGINLGLSAFALLPAVGSSGKVAKIAKNIPRVIGLLGAAGIALDENVHKSLGKLSSGDFKSITRDDWKNISHVAQALAGVSQMGRNAYNAAKYRGLTTKTASGEFTVKSKEGKSYTLKEADIKKINEVGKKEGNDKANKLFQTLTKSKDTLNADFKTSGVLKGVRSKEVKGIPTDGSLSADVQKVRRAMAINNESFKASHPGWTRTFNTDYDIYFNNSGLTTLKLPTFGIFSPSWQRTLNTHNQKRAKNTPTQQPTILPTNLPQLSFKHLSKNTPVHDLRKYVDSNGNLNQKASRILDAKLPNWKNRQFDTNGLANFLKSKGITDTNNINNFVYDNGRIVFWKDGGQVNKRLQSLKNGGSIRKYDIGGVADWYFNRSTNGASGRGKGFENLGDWTDTLKKDLAGNYIIQFGHSNAGDLKEAFNRNNAYTSNSSLVGLDLQSYYGTLGGNLSAEDFVNLYNTNAQKIRLFFNGQVNHSEKDAENVAAHNVLFREMFGNRSKETNDESLTYNLGYLDRLKGRLGSTTWMRRMDTYENEFDLNNADQNRIHSITGPNGQTFQVYKKANGDIGLWNPLPNPEQNPELNPQTNPEQNPLTNPLDDKYSAVFDQNVPTKTDSPGLREGLMQYGADLIGAGRLIGTLRTNRKIYNTVRNAMKPMLINTYELYSPVTGAFSEMLLRNRQGAQGLSQAYRPFTSDANLAAARMRQGQLDANELQHQGFIADDKEIKRTKAEALARQEDNIKRRTDVANTNRESINRNNRELAQLRADYKLKNWNAINTWLSGKEADARQNWENYRNYTIDAMTKQATLDMLNELSLMLDDLRRWLSQNGNREKSISEWPRYQELVAKLRELQLKSLDVQNSIYNRMYGWPFRRNYTFNYLANT